MKKKAAKKKRASRHDAKRPVALADLKLHPVAAVARKHDLPEATVYRWVREAGLKPPDGRSLRHHAPPLPPAPVTNGSRETKAQLEIRGLHALVRELVLVELADVVKRELPAAIDRALSRAYAEKR